MKKKRMILSAILVTVLAFTGCGNTQTNTSNTTSDTDGSQQSNEKVIRIGSPTTDGTQLVENAGLAYKLGYLDEELEKVGYKAEYVGFAQGGTAINEAFASGQLDVAFVGDVPEIIAKSNGLEVELFANLNSEAEMGIVAGKNSGIKKPTDLKGKKVVAAYGTVTHVYLNNLLQANGLSLDDVEVINDIANGGTLVASGNADAVVSTGTGVWQMSNSGVGDILTTSQGDAELSSQFFAMGRISYLKDNPDAAEAIIRALRKSKEYIEQNPEKAYETLATSDNPKELYEKIYPKELGFDNFDPQIKQEQIDRLNSLAEFLLGNGTISESVDAKSVINNDYYEAASKTFTK